MKRKFYIQLSLLLATVFLAPQLYKTVHIFVDHHGHLDCEAFQKKNSGINAKIDHCPICKYHFTTFDTTGDPEDYFVKITVPLTNTFPLQVFHYSSPAYHYLLRGPPVC